jgi:hypothetical protein
MRHTVTGNGNHPKAYKKSIYLIDKRITSGELSLNSVGFSIKDNL